MIKILANDGISQAGIDALTSKGFAIETQHIAQNDLISCINKEKYEGPQLRNYGNSRDGFWVSNKR